MGTIVTAPAPKISLAGPEHDYLYHNSTLALDVAPGGSCGITSIWSITGIWTTPLPGCWWIRKSRPIRRRCRGSRPISSRAQVYRTLTGVPGKTGVIYTLDRETGRFLWARPTVRQNRVADIDGASGRVTVNPATVPVAYGVEHAICPGPTGGANYMTGSYNPDNHTLFLPLLATCATMTALDPASGTAGTYAMANRNVIDPEAGGLLGTIHAVDAVTGQTRWVHRQRAGMQSLLSTGGGLLFAGDADGRLMALDQATGEELWAINLGSSITGYPATFRADSQQYLAVSTGRWLSDAFTPELTHGTQNTLFVFALPQAGIGARGPQRAQHLARGGAGFDDPALAQAFTRMTGAGVYSAAQSSRQGHAVYQRSCVGCHGQDFLGAPGIPAAAGTAFMAKWRGRSVGELFAYIRDFMPTGMGRSLSDAEYLAVTAHLLDANGAPPGEQPLDQDEAILRAIGIE